MAGAGGEGQKEHITTIICVYEDEKYLAGVHRFFEENYELRYNEMKQTEEYRSRHRMEAPGKSTEASDEKMEPPFSATEAPCKKIEAPFFATEAPGWQQLTDRELPRRQTNKKKR